LRNVPIIRALSSIEKPGSAIYVSLHFVMSMKNKTVVIDYENLLGVETIEK
jgi:hypothetical protein